MLWAEDNIELPNNYFIALVQKKSLEKWLTNDHTLKEKYSNTVKRRQGLRSKSQRCS